MAIATADLRRTTVARVTRHIIPFVMVLYLVAYIDRSNISVAALQMNGALGMTAQQYGWGAGLFFSTYILLEFPSNLILAHVGARRWIARIMVSWGVIASLMGLIQSTDQFYLVRILLGAAEAGFTPGIIYYLSRWYPSQDRAKAVGWFYIGAALASVIGLPLAGILLSLDGLFGVPGWRWVYLLEGLPAVVLGLLVLRLLPDSPASVPWLDETGRQWLTRTLAREAAEAPVSERAHWSMALRDSRVWLFSLVWLFQAFGTIGVTLFLPQIVRGLSGGSNFTVTMLSAAPFLLAAVLMFFNGRHSDAARERRLHLTLPLLAAGVVLALGVASSSLWVTYALLLLSIGLNWSIIPVFWAASTEYISGVAGAGAAALINSVANLAGLTLPPIIGRLRDATGNFSAALLMVAVAMLAAGAVGYMITPSRRPASVD
jgi:MFS family permease